MYFANREFEGYIYFVTDWELKMLRGVSSPGEKKIIDKDKG
jgi:hypothetical protein